MVSMAVFSLTAISSTQPLDGLYKHYLRGEASGALKIYNTKQMQDIFDKYTYST